MADNASIIIAGTVKAVKPLDSFTALYDIDIADAIRGPYDTSLTLYGDVDVLKPGEQYLLFIYRDDSVFWPSAYSLLVDSDCVMEMRGDEVIYPPSFTEKSASAKILYPYLKSLPQPAGVPKQIPITDFLPLQELIAKSDTIFTARIVTLSYPSAGGAGAAALSDITFYKGDAEASGISCLVPRDLEEGRKYLFFRCDGLSSMPTRSNSVMAEGTDAYQKAIEQLQ